MNIENIAKAAHEVNKVFCSFIGDNSQTSWEDAPDWQKESSLKGVEFHLANAEAAPEDLHKSWLEEKVKEGWTYGMDKDTEKKYHPCMVPYESLGVEHQTKDKLFAAVVKSFIEEAKEKAPAVKEVITEKEETK